MKSLKWEKQFLIFVFEIFYNFCKLFDFSCEFELSFVKPNPEFESISFKSLLLAMKNTVRDGYKQLFANKNMSYDFSGVIQRSFDQSQPWNYYDFFGDQVLKTMLPEKQIFLKDLYIIFDFLHINGSFLEGKVIEEIVSIFEDFKQFSLETQNIIDSNLERNQKSKGELFEINGQVNGKMKDEHLEGDQLNQQKKKQDDEWMTCTVCRICRVGLHVICQKCGHSLHFSHILEKVVSESYRCEKCGDCECLKSHKMQIY